MPAKTMHQFHVNFISPVCRAVDLSPALQFHVLHTCVFMKCDFFTMITMITVIGIHLDTFWRAFCFVEKYQPIYTKNCSWN